MSEPDFSIAPSGIVRLRWLGWEQEMKDTSRQGIEIGATLSQRVRAKELEHRSLKGSGLDEGKPRIRVWIEFACWATLMVGGAVSSIYLLARYI